LRRLRSQFQDDRHILSSISNLVIRLYPENTSCLICEHKTNLLKTDRKICYSFDLGKFTLIYGCDFCAAHKYFSDTSNRIVRYESNLATMTVEKGYRVAFDLVVKVGSLRYGDHRQLHEIQAYLKCSPARIELPLSTIGTVAKRFLDLCRILHQSRESEILEDIRGNGGYYLHFDGSTEQKCGQCSLLLMDSRSGHILESLMVESEKSDIIRDALEKVGKKYGSPLAVVSDLRSGFLKACTDVFGKSVVHILCHYHFLRTFRDEFMQNHIFIRSCMTKKWKLPTGLSKLLKSLPEAGVEKGRPKELKTLDGIEAYVEKTDDILNAYKYALRWILNFKQESSGKGVPFDLPYVDLYNRFVAGKKFIDAIFAKTSAALRLKYYYDFCRIVKKTKKLGHNEPGFTKALRQLEYAKKWFNKLRAILFLQSQIEDDRTLAPLSKQYQLTIEEAKMLPDRLDGFLKLLNREIRRCKNPIRIAFLKNLGDQVEKYQNNLRVPILSVTIGGKATLLVPPRTNNDLERLFRFVKSMLRRCSGRSKLPKEFGSVGALLPYYLTMKDHSTFRDIFKDERFLSEEFAKLFAKQWQPPKNLIPLHQNSASIVDERQLVALEG
jgi:hypothetical protein